MTSAPARQPSLAAAAALLTMYWNVVCACLPLSCSPSSIHPPPGSLLSVLPPSPLLLPLSLLMLLPPSLLLQPDSSRAAASKGCCPCGLTSTARTHAHLRVAASDRPAVQAERSALGDRVAGLQLKQMQTAHAHHLN